MNIEERRLQLLETMKKVVRSGFTSQKRTWRADYTDLYDLAASIVEDEDAAEKTYIRNSKIDSLLDI